MKKILSLVLLLPLVTFGQAFTPRRPFVTSLMGTQPATLPPDMLTNMWLWLRADVGVWSTNNALLTTNTAYIATNNNTGVGSWENHGSGGQPLTWIGIGGSNTFVARLLTNGPGGLKPCVQTLGATSTAFTNSFTTLSTTPTYFFLFKLGASQRHVVFDNADIGVGGVNTRVDWQAGSPLFVASVGTPASLGWLGPDVTNSFGVVSISGGSYTHDAKNTWIRTNGVEAAGTGTITADNLLSTCPTVIGGDMRDNANWADHLFYEVIVYNYTLSSNQIVIVENYLLQRMLGL